MRLTKKRIESLVYDPDGPSQQIEWDDRVENFGVRIYESGTKSFVIRYRNEHGRRRYMTLGKFGVLTLQQARKLALDKFFEIRQGSPTRSRRNAAPTRRPSKTWSTPSSKNTANHLPDPAGSSAKSRREQTA